MAEREARDLWEGERRREHRGSHRVFCAQERQEQQDHHCQLRTTNASCFQASYSQDHFSCHSEERPYPVCSQFSQTSALPEVLWVPFQV